MMLFRFREYSCRLLHKTSSGREQDIGLILSQSCAEIRVHSDLLTVGFLATHNEG